MWFSHNSYFSSFKIESCHSLNVINLDMTDYYDSQCEPLAVLDGPWNEHAFVREDCEGNEGDCASPWAE